MTGLANHGIADIVCSVANLNDQICLIPTERYGPMSELVEFRHLKFIAAVAETGNFTRAAERLFLSQPSLSKQIKNIEAELGIKIFNRTG